MFLCFLPDENTPRLWDFFIIQGWKGFLAACLALLDVSQLVVLEEARETILKIYEDGLDID